MAKPKNIILIVADSLRQDSVYKDGAPGLPYMEQHGIQFTNARSSGCWTLPGTSSLFTGMLPHQHGATSQSRWLKDEIPSLPEKLRTAGYKSIQVSANVVTTDIFNVSKGFDEVYKTWHISESRHPYLLNFVLSLNRPRIRRMLLKPRDMVFDTISEDLRQGIIWAQKTCNDSFKKAKDLIAENNEKGQGVFMFINLMESHYPYHIADTFTLLSKGIFNKIHEWKVLFYYLSQSFLKDNINRLSEADLTILRTKQQLAWKLIRDDIDAFVKEMHENTDNLVVFCSDHGDNFGDQGWQYHFSNVTDGGNKVPIIWLDHENPKAETRTHPVSSRFIQNDILNAVGLDNEGGTIMTETENNLPMLQSYWYDNEGETLDMFKYNQSAFIHNDKRFVLRAGKWMYAPVGNGGPEPKFELVENNFNPIEALNLPADRKAFLEKQTRDFTIFSDKVMNKGK